MGFIDSLKKLGRTVTGRSKVPHTDEGPDSIRAEQESRVEDDKKLAERASQAGADFAKLEERVVQTYPVQSFSQSWAQGLHLLGDGSVLCQGKVYGPLGEVQDVVPEPPQAARNTTASRREAAAAEQNAGVITPAHRRGTTGLNRKQRRALAAIRGRS